MTKKLLVIGLDGYEPSLADDLMRQGRMPALDKLHQRSAVFHLAHGPAKRTGLAWEHFATGLDPASANRYSAVEFDEESYRCTSRNTDLAPFAARIPVDTVVFDTPYFDLDRAPGVRGIVSWGAHDPGTKAAARPAHLWDEVIQRFGEYPAQEFIYAFTWPDPDATAVCAERLRQATHRRAEIARWLFAERVTDWQLGMVVVSELHSASEALWHGVDVDHPLHHLPSSPHARRGMEETYEAVDDLLATMVSSFPDASIMVFSMHGMGPNNADVSSMALLPEVMYRRAHGKAHLLRRGRKVAATAVPELAAEAYWPDHVADLFHASRQPLRGPLRRLRRKVPAPARRLYRRLFPARDVEPLPLAWMPASWYSPFWPDMDAFALPSFYDGQIRVNLVGRESAGRVPLSRYQETLSQIERLLRDCIDPRSGQSVVREIIRNQTPPLELGPTEADLLVVWEGCPLAIEHPELGTVGPVAYRRPGGHTGSHGIALFSDGDTEPGFRGERSAFDVAPSIIDYLTRSRIDDLAGQSFLAEARSPSMVSRPAGT